MAPRRRGHPAPGMEIQGLGSKVLSRAHFAVWLESSPPHILHLPQHPQTPVWLTERRKETLCGVANVCSYPQAVETRSCSVKFQLLLSLMSPRREKWIPVAWLPAVPNLKDML